jgi:hypothetical protein
LDVRGKPLLNGKILAKLCFKPLTDFFGAVCFDPHNLSPCPAGHRVPVQINLWATAPIVNIYFNLFLPPI